LIGGHRQAAIRDDPRDNGGSGWRRPVAMHALPWLQVTQDDALVIEAVTVVPPISILTRKVVAPVTIFSAR
jgi:hypothetical protein